MPIFRCVKCGCVDNTATSGYWERVAMNGKEPLCSECNPEIGKWHGEFEKGSADGMLMCNDGYLYSKQDFDRLKWRMKHQGLEILGVVKGDELEEFNHEG